MLAHLGRYTHRVAIAKSRLISADALTVAFTWKDDRAPERRRRRVMRLATEGFIRRLLINILPDGLHRIRHSGLPASAARRRSVATIPALLAAGQTVTAETETEPPAPLAARLSRPGPCWGGPMRLIERFERGPLSRSRAQPWGAS